MKNKTNIYNDRNKKNGGITLIALVITIIVLIILAGITINILLGQKGIIDKTKEAARLTQKEEVKEKIILLLAEYEIIGSEEGKNISDFFADKKAAGQIDEIIEDTIEYIIIEVDGYEFTIDKNTREITNISDTSIRITITYPEEAVGQTAKAIVTVVGNTKQVDISSLVYGWSNSITIEPASWTNFTSGAEITHAVAGQETWFLWVRANYVGGTTDDATTRISNQFNTTDNVVPTINATVTDSEDLTYATIDATVTYGFSGIKKILWQAGTKTIEDFASEGTALTKVDDTHYRFTATQNAEYTIYIEGNNGKTAITTKTVTEITTATIPGGFTVSSVTGERKTDDGLVVVAPDGSQFVWIPIENPVLDVQGKTDGEINTAIQAEITAGRYPMAIKVNATDYKGVLYDFTGTSSVNIIARTYSSTGTGNREPAILTSSGYDNTASNYTNAGITGITNATQFLAQIQNEYNQMIASVVEKGGFYIGRYETSINASKVQSKANVLPLVSVTWYYMYQKQKLYTSNNGITGVTSSMIWGSQWDQVMIWMKEVSNPGKTKPFYALDSTGMGNYSGTRVNTGSNNSYKVKNIYDMAGNILDWTMEANNTNCRIFRGAKYAGGYTGSSHPVSSRAQLFPTDTDPGEGSRLVLY